MVTQGASGAGNRNRQEETMVIFGRKENKGPAIVDFSGQWPLAFRVKLLTITGLTSSTPIPRRQP